MIREVKFESQDRRIKQILAALNANGIKDIEEANAICEAHGLDPYKTCEETQPICSPYPTRTTPRNMWLSGR